MSHKSVRVTEDTPNSENNHNTRNPMQLTGIRLDGVAAEAAHPGKKIKVWVSQALTSDDAIFHPIMKNMADVIRASSRKAGMEVDLNHANLVVLAARPDGSAQLWVDNTQMELLIMSKRDIEKGSLVYEKDIADIVELDFPEVKIDSEDKIVIVMRVDWRFGVFFDFNLEKQFDKKRLRRALGTLYRSLKYRSIYDAIGDKKVFDLLISKGWFPFVEILGDEFDHLAQSAQHNLTLDTAEQRIIASFDQGRLDRMLNRWNSKTHFASRTDVLQEAVDAFRSQKTISTIKIAVTEIDGILREAHSNVYGVSTSNQGKLLKFAVSEAERKAGGTDTLLFPAAFKNYLQTYTFKNFDPDGPGISAGSRHAVAHGAADPKTYTMTRALQALLTLDQLAFYT